MALLEIVRYKKALILEKKHQLELYKKQVKKSTRSLKDALLKDRKVFICEIKPASPSQGVINKNADVKEIAEIYAPFVDGISVLADEKYFGGSLLNVQKVSELNRCPVLCKDVVVAPFQIYEARYFGADAVLLMLSVLDDEQYRECERAAVALCMDIITEVHDEAELARATKLNAKIIGINNRNLKTLQIDLSTTKRLAPHLPKDAIIISESGFTSRTQVKELAPFVHGFLIGTSLMQAERIDLKLRSILFGRVKICGISRREDAVAAYQHGAYYGGLNFSSVSKRRVSMDEARSIKEGILLFWGGVFVNQPLEEVYEIATFLGLDFVQLHGDETDDYVRDLRQKLGDKEIWQAIRLKSDKKIPLKLAADRVLLDRFDAGQYGGTGQSFDWGVLETDANRHRYVVAGGVTADNIVKLDALNPFAIDIASGVEDSDPRKKSAAKIAEIFTKLRP